MNELAVVTPRTIGPRLTRSMLAIATGISTLLTVSPCRLRISLGLKPLNMEAPQKQSAVDVRKQEEARVEAEQKVQAADLRARIAA